MQARATQLNEWTADLSVPKVVWLSGLFNPQSFLTAVMQTTARRNDWPLDKTVIVTEVTKRSPDQVEQPSRDGAFIHGLTLEGAALSALTLHLVAAYQLHACTFTQLICICGPHQLQCSLQLRH